MSNQKSIEALYYTRCAVPTPLGIAARLGWFSEEFRPDGVAIRAVVESENAAQREAHYDHGIDNLFRLGGSIPALWARSKGTQTRLLALSWVDEFQAIVALPDSGIKQAAHLRGRRFGLEKHDSAFIDHSHASALRGIHQALQLAGASLSDIKLVDLIAPRNSIAEQGDERLSGSRFSGPKRRGGSLPLLSLLRREVDAIYLKGPRGLQLVHQLGLHTVVDLGSHADPLVRANNCTPRTLTVDQQLLDRRPDFVARFVSRIKAAGAWAKHHPEDAVRFIGDETSTASAWVKYGHGNDVHESLDIELSERSITALDDLKNFLVTWKYLPADFSIRQWIDAAPLHASLAERQQVA